MTDTLLQGPKMSNTALCCPTTLSSSSSGSSVEKLRQVCYKCCNTRLRMLSVERGIDAWPWESEERDINSNGVIQARLHGKSGLQGGL